MARIIPGVEINVVKEVVPKQLAPAGILGVVGATAVDPGGVVRAASWNTVIDTCGAGTAFSMPELRQALDNGVAELVIAPMPASAFATATTDLMTGGASPTKVATITASAPGPWANGLALALRQKTKPDQTVIAVDLDITDPRSGKPQTFPNLVMTPGNSKYLPDVINRAPGATAVRINANLTLIGADSVTPIELSTDGSSEQVLMRYNNLDAIFKVKTSNTALRFTYETVGSKRICHITRKSGDDWLPVASSAPLQVPGDESTFVNFVIDAMTDLDGITFTDQPADPPVAALPWPTPQELSLAGGTDASATAYVNALVALEEEPDVDLLVAAVQNDNDAATLTTIYSGIISHCERMATDSKGRIGFGEVKPVDPSATSSAQKAVMAEQLAMADALISDRFVLLCPNGYQGAVAGRIGSLDYYRSPTFKTLSGIGVLRRALSLEEQRTYLKRNIVPVVTERGRGTIIVRGLTTDGDQINVRRVADRAVRQVKAIGDLFIGRLNTQPGRDALKQKLTEALLQMEKDQAIVPSTDGEDPAFKVSVYSSQRDFALGIVRVDIAVRPVRAIDYIYATILVQV
jgi:hypothetical protein